MALNLTDYSFTHTSIDCFYNMGIDPLFIHNIVEELEKGSFRIIISEKRIEININSNEPQGVKLDYTPLEFLNLLFHEYEFVKAHSGNPSIIIPRWQKLDFSYQSGLYFFKTISDLISIGDDFNTKGLLLKLIRDEFIRRFDSFFKVKVRPVIIEDFKEFTDNIQTTLNSLKDNTGRLQFLIRYEIDNRKELEDSPYYSVIHELLKKKIEYYERIIKNGIVTSSIQKPTEDKIVARAGIVFNNEYVDSIISIVIPYFEDNQHPQLIELFKNGTEPSEKLLFNGVAIKMADLFNRLFDAKIITCYSQLELENWIVQHFKYRDKDNYVDFRPKYLSRIISASELVNKSPIISIIRDETNGKYILS